MESTAAGIAIVIVALGCSNHTVPRRPTAARPLTVPCGDIINSVRSAGEAGYRVVLGSVEVPPAFTPKTYATKDASWPYFLKAGLVVHAGPSLVTVTVPNAWRRRAAISWGNGLGVVSALQITGCPPSPESWNAYAGGIYTRSPSACVPLTFKIGTRSQTVTFGIGRRCGAAS